MKKQAAWAAVWAMIARGANQVTGLVVFVLLARLLEPEAFGLIALAALTVAFLNVFVEAGLGPALVQKKELTRSFVSTAWWMSVGLGLGLMVLMLVAAPWVSAFFEEPRLTPILRVCALSLVLSSLVAQQRSLLMRELMHKRLGFIETSTALVSGTVAVIAALAGAGVWALVTRFVLQQALSLTLLLWFTPHRPSLLFSKEAVGQLVRFSSGVMGSQLMFFVTQKADDLIIGRFFTAGDLGFYGVARRMLVIVRTLLIVPVRSVGLPVLSKMQDQTQRLQQAVLQISDLLLLIGSGAFLLLSAVSWDLVPVVFGEKWLASAPLMAVLSLRGMNASWASMRGPVLTAVGRTGVQFRVAMINGLVNLGVLLTVAWMGGELIHLAWAVVLTGWVLIPYGAWEMTRHIDMKLRTFAWPAFFPLLAGGGMYAAVWGMRELMVDLPAWSRLIVCIPLGLAVYLGLLRVLAPKQLLGVLDAAKALRRGRGVGGAASEQGEVNVAGESKDGA